MSDDQHEVINDGPLATAVRDAAEDAENEITEAWIVGEDGDEEVASNGVVAHRMLQQTMKGFSSDRIHVEADNSNLLDIAKNVVGSTQSDAEMGERDLSLSKVVQPPYPPELMSVFLEVDETHFRCVRTKVTDSVGRKYVLDSRLPVKEEQTDDKAQDNGESVSKSTVQKEVRIVEEFVQDCNEICGFEGVLDRAGMDHESIGWAAIEVIRSRDMKIKKLAHVPATRIRVLQGWKGFVEAIDSGKHVYYQPFGEKVVSKKHTNPINDGKVPYSPGDDGPLSESTAEWNMIDRNTGEPTRDFKVSANEILWIPKHHSNTIYYGYSDVVPSLGHLLNNVHIRDYLLQFFEHNTVPRYAIVIEGAKLADPVKKAITEYFSTHIKGKAHKTLIIPVPSMKGEVKIRFEKLAVDNQEGSFQETRKNNAQGIMTSHGVSPAIIGIAEHSELGSGKGLSQAEIYKDRIVTPLQGNWATPLNRLFRQGLGIKYVVLSFDPLDIRDRHNEMMVLTGYLDKASLTVNEVRKAAQLGGPVEGGDRPFMVVGNQLIFLDELNLETSTHIKEMEDENDGLKQSLMDERSRLMQMGQPKEQAPPTNGEKQPAKQDADR